MRPSIVVAVVTAIGVGAFLLWPWSSPTTVVTAVPATAAPTPVDPPRRIQVAPAPTPTDSTKPAGFDPALDPRIATLHDERDLVSYLDRLEAEARARGSSGDALARASAAGSQVREQVGARTVAMHLVDFGERLHRMEHAPTQ